jgi:hypothetical protein
MQKLNLEIQYVKGGKFVVAHSLSCRVFVNTMSLMKKIMLDNIESFMETMYSSIILLRICQNGFVFQTRGIIRNTFSMIVTIFLSQVIRGL